MRPTLVARDNRIVGQSWVLMTDGIGLSETRVTNRRSGMISRSIIDNSRGQPFGHDPPD